MSQTQSLLQGTVTPSYDGKVDEEQPAVPVEEPKGLAGGYHTWSDTFGAFELAIWHGLLYVLLGILFYSFILDTKLTIAESVYFAVSIFTTVGYGDITPGKSTAGKIFTIFFALYGIIILGIFLGILGDFAAETQHKAYKEVRNAATNKYLKLIKSKTGESPEDSEEEDEEEEEKDPNEKDKFYQWLRTYDQFAADIYAAVKDQKVLLVILLILSIPIVLIEKWSLIDGLYWLAITGTTIGLGDLKPDGEFAKFYSIVFIPLAVALVGKFVGRVATKYVEKRNAKAEEEFLSQALDGSSLDKMDTDHDNKVSKAEFLVFMLKTLGKADKREMQKVLDIFDKLDKDGSGYLSREDIEFIPKETANLQRKKV